MQFIDSIDVKIYDINKCTKCGCVIMPEDETVITENINGGILKIDHFNCAYPRGGL